MNLTIKKYLEEFENGEYDKFLKCIFKDLNAVNLFLKSNLIVYIFQSMGFLYDERIEELKEWIKENNDIDSEGLKQITKIFNNYAFEQGKYNLINIDEIEKNKLNQILTFNKKPTLDNIFNKFINHYMKTDIKEMNMNVLISSNYFNYRYNSLPSFIVSDKDIKLLNYEQTEGTNLKNSLTTEKSFSDEFNEIGKSFYMDLSGFSRNILFKTLCGMLYLYLFTNRDNFKSYNDYLNVIMGFEFLQYSRTIYRNDLINSDGGLITYITFKNGNSERLNYRYQESIKWLRNPSRDRLTYTKIEDDEKGLYITTNWEIKGYDELLNAYLEKDYEKMLFIAFNLQYLTRGTCYYSILIYCVLTSKIPQNLDLIDLYAISHNLTEFKEYIKNKFVDYKPKNRIDKLTYSNILNFF